MRVLPSLAAPPPPVGEPTGRSERPLSGWRSSSGDRSGVKGDRQVVPVGTRGAERSKASTEAPLMQAEGGATWGAPENGPEARAGSLPQVRWVVDVGQTKKAGQGETAVGG